MKQIDRIRSMSAEELADVFGRNSICDFCKWRDLANHQRCYADTFTDCIKGCKAWLESEVEDEQQTKK